MRKIKDLQADEFPGTDEKKFREWKDYHVKYLKQSNVIAFAILASMLLLLIFRDQLLPALVFGILLLAGLIYLIPSISKIKRMQKEAGIDSKKLKSALKNSMKRASMFFLAVLLSGMNLVAQADHEPGYQSHDGFFLSMSVGPGMVNINDDITNGPYNNMKMNGIGAMIDIKLGAAVNENLILHGDIISISSAKLDVEADGSDLGTIEGDNSVGNIMLGGGITYYFMPANVFVSGSAGIARFTITTNDQTSSTQAGLGLHVKAGKEWWISSRWGLGVSAIFNYANVKNEADSMTELLKGTSFGISFNATFN